MESAKACRVPLETDVRILETNHGRWEGSSKDWITGKYPKSYHLWINNPSNAKFPKGETFYDTVKRVKNFLFNRKWVENSLIVTHDNIVRIILTLIERKQIDNIWSYNISPAGVTIISVDDEGKFKIIKINETSHLNGLGSNISIHAL